MLCHAMPWVDCRFPLISASAKGMAADCRAMWRKALAVLDGAFFALCRARNVHAMPFYQSCPLPEFRHNPIT